MNSLRLLPLARRLTLAFLLAGASAASFAIPIMDMHIEDMIAMGPDFKKELALNANQETLWNQVDSKTRQLIRERVSRRERLRAAIQQGLAAPNVELRDMAGALDAETAASTAEEKQLREWWLTVNDALNETQRRAVATFFSEQMLRVESSNAPHADAPKSDDSHKGGGRGGRGGGGMGGMGGGGGMGGAGGAGASSGTNSVNVPIPGY
ncbi:MAG TPA: hypothetical protein VGP06_06640 [Janthinobacterium sp.]|nr:hypothetical protein [Janthinobacterium sp.]